ncbi:MAG: minor capsid protein [Clostridia bacterium]|nr:minor capsid protein [Clostridia bacterium]
MWGNTEKLIETLNEELINCVATGRNTNELKQLLQERFNVSYSNADSIVRTETAHIQTQAAKQRYTDYGIQEVEVWADEDERRCEVCGKLH